MPLTGICPHCGTERILGFDGKIGKHKERRDAYGLYDGVCPGSGKRPKRKNQEKT